MSCVIQTLTAFLDEELLIKSLEECQCAFRKELNRIFITTSGMTFLRQASFYKDRMGKFVLEHVSHMNIKDFLTKLDACYQKAYKQKMEELERQRLELEEKKLDMEQKKMIEEKRKLDLAQKKAQEEKVRLEEQRKEYVEKQKQEILQRAKEMGYDAQVTKKNNKIQLVLVRRSG